MTSSHRRPPGRRRLGEWCRAFARWPSPSGSCNPSLAPWGRLSAGRNLSRTRAWGSFGLQNAVFTAGDTFVEVVSPVREGTTAGRYLERRGGDTGYMAIFQVAGTHLRPRDVPGAIVSIDWADPPGSWRWAGPAWTGAAAPHDIVGPEKRLCV